MTARRVVHAVRVGSFGAAENGHRADAGCPCRPVEHRDLPTGRVVVHVHRTIEPTSVGGRMREIFDGADR